MIEIDENIKKLAEDVFKYLQPFCISIYLGGSRVEGYIRNPHDIDFICFSNKPVDMCHIRRYLYFYAKNHDIPSNCDFIQVRTKQNEEHAYGSFINSKMIKLVGEDIDFEFDVIDKDRQEYIEILKSTIYNLNHNKVRNQKRWYQVLRGYYILQNNSYDLTDEQIDVINMIHDQEEGWEVYKIKEEDLDRLSKEAN